MNVPRRRWLLLVTAVPVLLTAPASQAGPVGTAERRALPLGGPGLVETRTTRTLAPGVSYTTIVRGHPSSRDAWTVTVAVLPRRTDATALVERLRAAGFTGRIERLASPRGDDVGDARAVGFAVRSGRLAAQADAVALQQRLTAAGFTGSVQNTAEDGRPTTGPWVVRVLRVDAATFRGAVRPALATGIVPGRETVSAMAAAAGSLAAVNGGYFVINPTDGTPGDLAGVSVIRGRLLSEAVAGRTSLVLPRRTGAGAAIARVRTTLWVRARDGSLRELDGLDRAPGLVRSCGGVGGDQPTQRPLHDVTCTDPNELIAIRPEFGDTAPAGPGVEVALDAAGVVTSVRSQRGGAVPSGGSLLQGTGDAASWLTEHAEVGSRVRIRQQLRVGRHALPLTRQLGVVNGGPRLLSHRRVDVRAQREGFVHSDDPAFYWNFGIRRNPRTIAGTTADGDLLLVTSEGRAPGYSVGLSFVEEARVMRALGAVDATNLDGGGSTAMVIGDKLVTRPSDTTGERPVGDALLITARR